MSERILRSPDISPVGSVVGALPEGVRAAIDDAYRRGYEEGGGALARDSAILADKLTAAEARLLEAARAATVRDVGVVLDLAVELAEWFSGQALLADPERARAGVAAIVETLDEPRAHTLFVHPDILETLAGLPGSELAGIQADPSLAPDELRLTTDTSTVERVWHQAVERLRPTLLREIARETDQAG